MLRTRPFPKSEYDQRINRAKQLMKKEDLDAIIATHSKNFEYLTAGWRLGFDPVGYMMEELPPTSRPSFVIVPVVGDPVVLVPTLFGKESGWKELTNQNRWIDDIRTWHGLPFKAYYLEERIEELGPGVGKNWDGTRR